MKSLLAERSANFYSVLSVRHLHISHDAAYLPPKFRVTFVFHFSWVLQPCQQKSKNNAYAKFLGANKVHYGRCASGVLRIQQSPLQYSALFALSAAALGLDDVSNSNKICGIVPPFNRPFSSSKNSLSKRGWVQNLSCAKELHLHENKNYFHINGFALCLALKQRLRATRKWPIRTSTSK